MATLADLLRGGYTPPTTSALADPIKEHFRNLPQTLETNQRAMDKTMAGMFKTDIMGRPNPNYYPEAMQEFTQNYMPNFMGATAFHGTPHKILGKFDINKVGTGEGAQAYGHGMYFAEAPDVAKQYATNRSYVGKFMAGTPDKTPWEANRIAQDTLNVHGDNAIAQLKSTLKANSQLKNPRQLEANKQLEDAIDILKTNQLQPTGNLYKVDIPDEYIPKMLNYDMPIKNQPELYELVRSNIKDPDIRKTFEHNAEKGITGANVYQNYIGGKTDADRSANALKIGIKGIRYLDDGSRGKSTGIGFNAPKYSAYDPSFGGHDFNSLKEAEEFVKTNPSFQLIKPTSNFVVFDPSNVKILEENAKPIARKELIQQQIDKIE
jgi:hypothetical protein